MTEGSWKTGKLCNGRGITEGELQATSDGRTWCVLRIFSEKNNRESRKRTMSKGEQGEDLVL